MSEQETLQFLEPETHNGDGSTLAEQFYEEVLKNCQSEREMVEALEARRNAIQYVGLWNIPKETLVKLVAGFQDNTLITMSQQSPGVTMGGIVSAKAGEQLPADYFAQVKEAAEGGINKAVESIEQAKHSDWRVLSNIH